jgi:hypothetical protein
MAVACVINPVMNLFLIPYFQTRYGNGATGAAISLLLTELVLGTIGVVVIRSCFNKDFFVRTGRAALATLGMGLAVYGARELGLAPAILVGLLVYPVLAVAFRILSREELAQLFEMVRARRRRVPAAFEVEL